MEAYMMRELAIDLAKAKSLRAEYWREHGTTLAGMMHHHGTDPVAFLDEVQDIDFSCLVPNPALAKAIQNLSGRKIVYTNGSSGYAKNAVFALGLSQVFDGLYGIDHAGYISKPYKTGFERVFAKVNLNHKNAIMFEDDPRNLFVPHEMGLKTVLVGTKSDAAHIQYQTDDLTGFILGLVQTG